MAPLCSLRLWSGCRCPANRRMGYSWCSRSANNGLVEHLRPVTTKRSHFIGSPCTKPSYRGHPTSIGPTSPARGLSSLAFSRSGSFSFNERSRAMTNRDSDGISNNLAHRSRRGKRSDCNLSARMAAPSQAQEARPSSTIKAIDKSTVHRICSDQVASPHKRPLHSVFTKHAYSL